MSQPSTRRSVRQLSWRLKTHPCVLIFVEYSRRPAEVDVRGRGTRSTPSKRPTLMTGETVSQTRIALQVALNGDRTKTAHPATPVSVEQLVRDASACVAAGARAIHLHPRDHEGFETLDAGVVDDVVAKVRDACGVPVGVTTSAEIEPDHERRIELVRAWCAPDYTSVNLSEMGATEIIEVLVEAGIGIEAGVWSVEDAERLAASGLGGSPASWSSPESSNSRTARTRPLTRSGWSRTSIERWTGSASRRRGCSTAMGRSRGFCWWTRFAGTSTPASVSRTRCTDRTVSEPRATRHSFAPPASWERAPPKGLEEKAV